MSNFALFSVLMKVITIVLSIIELNECMSCVDENGDYVEWFIVYKMPKLETSSSEVFKSGFGYTFITDKTINSNDWTTSKKLINQKNSIFGQTIGPLIGQNKNSKDMSFVVYNDQSPDSVSSSSAHSKGIFGINSKGGFWLTHSVPKFPSLSGSYKFPENAKHNGQIAICISIDSKNIKTIDNIALQLLLMRPKIYGISISNDLSNRSKNWLNLEKKMWIKNDNNSQLSIVSKNGMVFTSFAKSNKYTEDLYSGLIANKLKENLLVQSWRNGAGSKLDSDCTHTYKVQNIDKIRIFNMNSGLYNVDWNSTEDHSKWMITSDDNKDKFICISDINRMKSQFKRGGGSLCLKSNKVWNIFKKSVESIEGCKIKMG